jgi:succinate dehydrogenase / fumarate reductase, cytochrome b subunit
LAQRTLPRTFGQPFGGRFTVNSARVELHNLPLAGPVIGPPDCFSNFPLFRMSWLTQTLSSSVGRKLVMAITGLFLCSFLVIHLLINLQMLRHDGGDSFNFWAHFMATNWLIRAMEIVLMLALIFHAYDGLYLALKNRKARGANKYVVNHSEQNSQWASRNMALLGTILLIFLIVHFMNFWVRSRFGILGGLAPIQVKGLPDPAEDLYSVAATAFRIPWYVGLYVVAQIALGYHLWHGFKSGFQTLGLNHRKYTPAIRVTGYGFAVAMAVLFAAIPLIMFFDQASYPPHAPTAEAVQESLSSLNILR